MDEADRKLRNATYEQFVELGRAPTADEVASAASLEVRAVQNGWRRLHDMHALVLDPSTWELRMLNPFSAVPTAYRVQAAGRWWYANCAWDAFGVFGALHSDGRLEASCPDCGEAINVSVADGAPSETGLVFHCLVPARNWWNDIAFT